MFDRSSTHFYFTKMNRKKTTNSVAWLIGITASVLAVIQGFDWIHQKGLETKNTSIDGNWRCSLSGQNIGTTEYLFYLTETNGAVSGDGEKIRDSSGNLVGKERISISIQNGKINYPKVRLQYELKGKERSTVGDFNLEISNTGAMNGGFRNSAGTTGAMSCQKMT